MLSFGILALAAKTILPALQTVELLGLVAAVSPKTQIDPCKSYGSSHTSIDVDATIFKVDRAFC